MDSNESDGIEVSYSTNRLRQLGSTLSQPVGREFGTKECEAFLLLYGSELIDELDQTVRKFLVKKLVDK